MSIGGEIVMKNNTKEIKNDLENWLPFDVFPENKGHRIPWEDYDADKADEDVEKFVNEYPEVINEFRKHQEKK